MIMRLDLEGDGVTLPDVDNAGILTDSSEQLTDRRLLRDVEELPQMHF
jgi:hypothetical protein